MNELLLKSLMANIVRQHNAQVVCAYCNTFFSATTIVCTECNDYKGLVKA